MEYVIITGVDVEELVGRVNDLLKDGFKCLGGVQSDLDITGDASEIYTLTQYIQSMIKE